MNVVLIAANVAVWVLYELPDLGGAVTQAAFYPCAVVGTCQAPQAGVLSWFTAMFLHASWRHLLGNMLYLAIFGTNVEAAIGHRRLRHRGVTSDAPQERDDQLTGHVCLDRLQRRGRIDIAVVDPVGQDEHGAASAGGAGSEGANGIGREGVRG